MRILRVQNHEKFMLRKKFELKDLGTAKKTPGVNIHKEISDKKL